VRAFSQTGQSAQHLETGEPTGGRLGPNVEMFNTRALGAAARPLDQFLDRGGRSLEHGFDGSVRKVPDPTRHVPAGCLASHGFTEPDALHVARDAQVDTLQAGRRRRTRMAAAKHPIGRMIEPAGLECVKERLDAPNAQSVASGLEGVPNWSAYWAAAEPALTQ